MKKKFLLSLICASISLAAQAQSVAVKLNATSLALKSIVPSVEFKLGAESPFTAGIGVSYALERDIKLDALAEQTNGEKFEYEGSLSLSGFSITPFVRWYPGAESMKGFYVGVFGRYLKYDDLGLPYAYTKDGEKFTGIATGYAKGFGGGLDLGAQFPIGPVILDVFFGAGYAAGKSWINVYDPENLTAEDYAEIKQKIDENKTAEVFGLGRIIENIEAGSNETSAWAESKGIPILRGGIQVGIAF